LAFKGDVGNWIFSTSWDLFWEFLRGFFGELWGIFLGGFFWRNCLGGIYWEVFLGEIFGRIFWDDCFGRIFLGRILCLHCQSQLSYLNMAGINSFVKILGKGRWKEGGRILDPEKCERKLITLKNSKLYRRRWQT
jgi:hypothetical protein